MARASAHAPKPKRRRSSSAARAPSRAVRRAAKAATRGAAPRAKRQPTSRRRTVRVTVRAAARRPVATAKKRVAIRRRVIKRRSPPSAPPTAVEVSRPPVASPVPPPPPSAAAPPEPVRDEDFQIPTGYGDHRIVLMVKDPWWLYAYWEIQPTRERAVRSQLAPHEISGLRSVLRVYDVTGRAYPQEPAHAWWDTVLSNLANNWYLHANAPDRAFVVEIGLLTAAGRFLMLARSNPVTTPRFGPSDVIDEDWMTADEAYWRLFGMATGIGSPSSAGLKELLQRMPSSAYLASAGAFVPTAEQPSDAPLRLEAELVLHGTTASKATVIVQDETVKVRPDGTFGLRVALPDGAHTIPVDVTSPDGRTHRRITTVITRRTEGKGSAHRRRTKAPPPEIAKRFRGLSPGNAPHSTGPPPARQEGA